MARPNRSALARSLALPRTPLRNGFPVLRYGTIGSANGALSKTQARTDGLLDAAVDWGHYCQGHRAEVTDFDSAVRAARDPAHRLERQRLRRIEHHRVGARRVIARRVHERRLSETPPRPQTQAAGRR